MRELIHHTLRLYTALGWPARIAIAIGLPALTFTLGVLVVVQLPSDYFVRVPAAKTFRLRHPAIRVLLTLLKNLLGATLCLAGIVMALPLVPGPGVLFMLLGLGLVDFPGKRKLKARLLCEPHILSSVNKMRARFGKLPLQAELPSDS